MGIQLGTLTKTFGNKPDVVEVVDPELSDYVDSFYFRSTLPEAAKAGGVPIGLLSEWRSGAAAAGAINGTAQQPDGLLNPHTALFGMSGSGKTQFMLSLIQQHLQAKSSVIAVDPQMHTLQSIAQAAMNAGVPTEHITILSPMETAYVAGWNPLIVPGQPIADSVDDLMTLFQGVFSDSWGYRLEMVLNKSLTILATHGLSLYELPAFLKNEPYRTNLLTRVQPTYPPGRLYEDACAYFLEDFNRWSRSEQDKAVGPVINKVDAMLRNDFFFGTFCGYHGEQSSFRFADFWREPRVLLVHMAEGKFDPTGIKLLGALVAQQLYRTALLVGKGAPRNVVLWLDEMGVQGRHFGTTLQNIMRIARAQQLQLLMAGQDLDQFDSHVLSSLMGAATRVFFQLIGQDSKRIASDLGETMIDTKTFPKQRVRMTAVKNGNQLSLDKREYYLIYFAWPSDEAVQAMTDSTALMKKNEQEAREDIVKCRKELTEYEKKHPSWRSSSAEREMYHTYKKTQQDCLATYQSNATDYASYASRSQRALDAMLASRRACGVENESYYLTAPEHFNWLESWIVGHDPTYDEYLIFPNKPPKQPAKNRVDLHLDIGENKVPLFEYLRSFPLVSYGPGRCHSRFSVERRANELWLVEWFPRVTLALDTSPNLSISDEWTMTLRGLKRQEAIVHLAGQRPFQIRTPDMPNLRASFEADSHLVQTIMAANGSHSAAHVASTARQRREEVSRVSALANQPTHKDGTEEESNIGMESEDTGEGTYSVTGEIPASKRRVVAKSAARHKVIKKRLAPPVQSDDSL